MSRYRITPSLNHHRGSRSHAETCCATRRWAPRTPSRAAALYLTVGKPLVVLCADATRGDINEGVRSLVPDPQGCRDDLGHLGFGLALGKAVAGHRGETLSVVDRNRDIGEVLHELGDVNCLRSGRLERLRRRGPGVRRRRRRGDPRRLIRTPGGEQSDGGQSGDGDDFPHAGSPRRRWWPNGLRSRPRLGTFGLFDHRSPAATLARPGCAVPGRPRPIPSGGCTPTRCAERR